MPESRQEKILAYVGQSLRFAYLAMRKLGALAPERKYALVQAHNMPDYLVFAGFFQKRAGKPLVLDLHDLTVELFGSKWGRRKAAVLLPVLKLAERLSCGFADALITASPGFVESLIRRGIPSEKITLVLNTADPRFFRFDQGRKYEPINRAQGPRLLYHGTVAERFGLAKAIDAAAILRKTMPGTKLNIYGHYDPSYRMFLEQKVREERLEKNVQLHGWKSLEEIYQIIRNSDIGVVPYLKDDFMDLALSTKTFEYAASGLPVAASRLKSLHSLFSEDCVSFADPSSAEDLAAKIARLCADPQLREKQARAAAAVLPSISGEVMAGRYLGLINGLIGRGDSRGRAA